MHTFGQIALLSERGRTNSHMPSSHQSHRCLGEDVQTRTCHHHMPTCIKLRGRKNRTVVSSWAHRVFWLHIGGIHTPMGGLGLPEERVAAARAALPNLDDHREAERSPLHNATHNDPPCDLSCDTLSFSLPPPTRLILHLRPWTLAGMGCARACPGKEPAGLS